MDELTRRRRNRLYPLIGLVVLALLLLAAVVGLKGLLGSKAPTVVPPREQCLARMDGQSASLSLEQANNAAIIVGESIRRGLPARAATIALATAMQESALKNIDYGDRDSVGLFQQRPSQGWGTVAQIMDPWYSSGKFYDELVKVKNWQTGDINDMAQKVQRSGVPDGYRKHVEQAKILSSALTGHSAASVSCINRSTVHPETAQAIAMVKKAFQTKVEISTAQATVRIVSKDPTMLWAATQMFMMTTGNSGVTAVTVGPQNWTGKPDEAAAWQGQPDPKATEAVISLRS